jgi:excisionase family DNA binding protein
MTVKEAAEELNLNPSTVYELCAKGRLGHRRIGLRKGSGRIEITEAHLSAYLESCEVRPDNGAGATRSPKRKTLTYSGRPDGKPLELDWDSILARQRPDRTRRLPKMVGAVPELVVNPHDHGQAPVSDQLGDRGGGDAPL